MTHLRWLHQRRVARCDLGPTHVEEPDDRPDDDDADQRAEDDTNDTAGGEAGVSRAHRSQTHPLVVELEFAAAVETEAAELEGVLVTVRTEGVDRTADDVAAVEIAAVDVVLLVEADDGAADEVDDLTAEDEEITTLLEATAVVLVRYVLATVVLLLASVVPWVAAPAAAAALVVVTPAYRRVRHPCTQAFLLDVPPSLTYRSCSRGTRARLCRFRAHRRLVTRQLLGREPLDESPLVHVGIDQVDEPFPQRVTGRGEGAVSRPPHELFNRHGVHVDEE